jgi:NitT/TauT family transport system permease protein
MRTLFEPLKPISSGRRVALGILGFVLVFALWGALTWGGIVKPLFLASPSQTFTTAVDLFVEYSFLTDIGITIWRVVGGFLIAAAMAVPIGIVMGAFKPFEGLLEPLVSFSRYLPASAFIPLTILWLGVGEAQKLAIIFIGSAFQLTLMVAVVVGAVRLDLVEAAYTLGAERDGIVLRVVLPAAAPHIFEALRLVLGWAWTYVIVAELIGASKGIGHMIMDAQRLLDTGQMISGIIIIGLIGLVSDFLFKTLNERLFPWYSSR